MPCLPAGTGREESGMTLKEMAVSYRREAELLRHRMHQVQEMPARDMEEEIAKRERLRLLKAMRRDVRDVAVLCERYYDRSYRGNQDYHI